MDLALYGVAFLAGGTLARIFFGGRRLGPFEESIMNNLLLGKRVILSVDEDCYIFEMQGTKVRITKGTAIFEEEGEQVYGINASNVVSLRPDKPSDDSSPSV